MRTLPHADNPIRLALIAKAARRADAADRVVSVKSTILKRLDAIGRKLNAAWSR
jgi:hypothetical protein